MSYGTPEDPRWITLARHFAKEHPHLYWQEVEDMVRREYYAETNAEKRLQEKPPH